MPHAAIFHRAELMLGTRTLDALQASRVAIFGLGGVGSWCAEALVRSGVGRLLLVDSDDVSATNVNRQLMATTETVGRVKVEVLAERLRAINPDVELDVRPCVYDATTAGSFALADYDYVVDAIDSLSEKAALIRHALSIPSVTLFASMGAALSSRMSRGRPWRRCPGEREQGRPNWTKCHSFGRMLQSLTCSWGSMT